MSRNRFLNILTAIHICYLEEDAIMQGCEMLICLISWSKAIRFSEEHVNGVRLYFFIF